MKRLLTTTVTSLAFVATLFASPVVFADGTGQIGGGAGAYQVKNLTQGGSYASSATANKCEELQYSIRLHNSGYTAVNNLNVKATLPASASTTNKSVMTASYTNGVVPSTTAAVTVNLTSAQNIEFESGSTKLYDGNGAFVRSLSDGITGSGVNLDSLSGSRTEYVVFKAKVNCSEKPVCEENCTPVNPPVVTTGSLPNTGPGAVAAIFGAVTTASTIAYYAVSRRFSRQ